MTTPIVRFRLKQNIVSGLAVISLSCYYSAYYWRRRFVNLVTTLTVYGVLYYAVAQTNNSQGRFSQLAETGGESSREVYYASAYQMLVDSPLVGAGFGNFQVMWDVKIPVVLNNGEVFMHSDYLEVLSETGVLGGFLLFGAVALLVVRVFLKLEKGDKAEGNEEALYVKIAFCGLLGFGLQELVNFESKVLCNLLLSSVYFAVLARFVSIAFVWKLTRSKRIVLGCGLCAAIAYSVFASQRMKGVGYAAKAEAQQARITGFHSMGLPAPPNELAEVEADLLEAIRYNPEYMSAYWIAGRMAMSHMYYGKEAPELVVARSVDFYDQALSLCPDMWRLWAERGQVLACDPKRGEEARASIEQALAIAPSSVSAQFIQAQFLLKHGGGDGESEARRILERMSLIEEVDHYYPRVKLMLEELE